MTPQKQRIAIAEACGWTDCYYDASRCAVAPTGMFTRYAGTPSEVTIRVDLPDYLNDLNAMHEAEESIRHDHDSWGKYLVFLSRSAPVCRVFSTAAQRAEAFLRTIEKWEDSQ